MARMSQKEQEYMDFNMKANHNSKSFDLKGYSDAHYSTVYIWHKRTTFNGHLFCPAFFRRVNHV